ncbi:MAG: fibronectin type III domain-containing protein [Candidatus Parvarchaeota archaeon]
MTEIKRKAIVLVFVSIIVFGSVSFVLADALEYTPHHPNRTSKASILSPSAGNKDAFQGTTNKSLSVNVTLKSTNQSTVWDYAVVTASVTSGVNPVSGASVSFSDSFGSYFTPSVALTNSTGCAIVEVQFNTLNYGTDVITAEASLAGYTTGIGSSTVSVSAYSNTQLAVSLYLQNTQVAGGSEDIVYGTVAYVYNYYGSLRTTPIANATVSVSDHLGISDRTESASNGNFQVAITLPWLKNDFNDIITVSVQLAGYSPTLSSVPLLVTSSTNLFKITFTESGLAQGTVWNVTVNGTLKSTESESVFFSLPNGTYPYSIGQPIGYSANPNRGEVIVNGVNRTINISFSVGWSLPSAPQNLTAIGGPNSIILKWSPPETSGAPPGFTGSGIEYYYIYRGTSSGNEQYYGDTNGTNLRYIDSSVTVGAVYFYEITAVNPVGQSGFSNEASAQPVAITVPLPPANLTGTPESNGIYLTFSPPPSNGGSQITEYIIYKGTQPSSEVVFKTLPANTTYYLDSQVVPGQTYYYFVVAVNSIGQSNPSSVITVVALKNVPNIPFWNINSPYFVDFILIATLIAIVTGIPIAFITAKHTKGMRTDLRRR